MTMNTSKLSALLGSRICHDLISPLGAIGNGVELLQMSGAADSAELSLISESVENANARIRLFRVAFGAGNPDQRISAGEIASILRPMGQARQLTIGWDPITDMARDDARLIFLLLLCLETALPYGGDVQIEPSGARIVLRARAERMRHDPVLWRQLHTDGAEVPQASEIQFPLARLAAAETGRSIDTVVEDGRIDIAV